MATVCDKCKHQKYIGGPFSSPNHWRCKKVVLRTEFNACTGESDEVLDTCANVNKGDCKMFEEACPPWPPEKVRAGNMSGNVLSWGFVLTMAMACAGLLGGYKPIEAFLPSWVFYAWIGSIVAVMFGSFLVSDLIWKSYEKSAKV